MNNYYLRIWQNLQEQFQPLYNLVGKGKAFEWTPECEDAFSYTDQELAGLFSM